MTTADECLPFGLEHFIAYTQGVKAEHVIHWAADYAGTDTEPDMVPACHLTWSDVETSLLVVAPEMSIPAILWAIHTVGGPSAPDSVTIASDAKVGTSMINPQTGEDWKPGELASSDNADALVYLTQWRNGRRRHTLAPYVADKHGGTLVWADLQSQDSGDGTDLDAPLFDALKDNLLCECSAPVQALTAAMHLDREHIVKHSLAALMPALGARGFMQALGSNNDTIADYVKNSVPGAVTE